MSTYTLWINKKLAVCSASLFMCNMNTVNCMVVSKINNNTEFDVGIG